MLTGDVVTAEQTLGLGFLNYVVSETI